MVGLNNQYSFSLYIYVCVCVFMQMGSFFFLIFMWTHYYVPKNADDVLEKLYIYSLIKYIMYVLEDAL